MPKCSYCGGMYEFPKGLTFVKTDGTIKHLCSSKCKRNMAMKKRKVRWILKKKKEHSSAYTLKDTSPKTLNSGAKTDSKK